MKILIIATNKTGGASIAAHRLCDNLAAHGHQSNILACRKDIPSARLVVCNLSERTFMQKVKAKIAGMQVATKMDNKYHYFNQREDIPLISSKSLIGNMPYKPDIIIIHWATGFINVRNVSELEKITGARVFWYLVDMLPMTGGCHYTWDCRGFASDCSNCPAIIKKGEKKLSKRNLHYKLKYILPSGIGVIAGSRSLFEQAGKSAVFSGKRIWKVLLPVHPHIFRPFHDKSKLRKQNNIPVEASVFLIGSRNMNEARKGFAVLDDALKMLISELSAREKDQLFFLIIGRKPHTGQFSEAFPLNHKYTGLIEHEEDLVSAYQLADFFICPSLEDAGPMMINESVMCGTPVICFNTGVAGDLIVHAETGFIAKEKTALKLKEQIIHAIRLKSDEKEKISKRCRETALLKCSPEVQMKQLNHIFAT